MPLAPSENISIDALANRDTRYTDAESAPVSYASHVSITSSPTDVRLAFGVVTDATPQHVKVRVLNNVYLHPVKAVEMAMMILKQYGFTVQEPKTE